MSDNDLIKRGDVADRAFRILKFLTELEREGRIRKVDFSILYHDIGAIAFSPTAPQEMSAKEYIRVHERMCDFYFGKEPADMLDIGWCGDCPFGKNGRNGCWLKPGRNERSIAIVEKWAREHPEERSDNQ